MKNYSLMSMAAIGLIAASCSTDEPTTSLAGASKDEIKFTVTADKGTRASSAYENGTDVKKITVSAWAVDDPGELPAYGSSNTGNANYFLNDVLVRGTGESSGTFNYTSGARYWPANGETLDFFAVVDNDAPQWNGAGEFGFTATNGKPGLGTLTQLEIDEMPDLLYAYTPNQKRNPNTLAQQNVSFNFNHAFAKVIVSAEVKNPNIRVYITDMSIVGVVDKGQFVMPYKSGDGPTIVNNPAQWIIPSDVQYREINNKTAPYSAAKPVVLDMNSNCKAKDFLVGGGGVGQDLLVIPYDYNGRNGSGKYQTYIRLKGYAYNIANANAGFDEDTDMLIFPKRAADGSITPTDILIPIEFNWQMGTVNRYNIVFDCGNGGGTTTNPNDPSAFIRIGYEVEVKDWSTGETISTEYKK